MWWKALLWDHDGVLVDTEKLYFQANREILAEVGVELSEADYRRYLLIANSGAWHLAAERGCSAAEIADLKRRRDERYRRLLLAEDVAIAGVSELLAELQPRVRMAIVTSSQRVHFDAIHGRTDLPRYFELILAREDYGASKPAPEPYLTALERLQLPASECLVIEDSERGLCAAKAAGIACWVIPSALTRDSDFSAADRRFDDLPALRRALLERVPPAP
ncbi:MAG TPA: HAD family phosphatase [Polyangiales bacterium]|nr:HAD family phosphatase [Polyangiales bacterium]